MASKHAAFFATGYFKTTGSNGDDSSFPFISHIWLSPAVSELVFISMEMMGEGNPWSQDKIWLRASSAAYDSGPTQSQNRSCQALRLGLFSHVLNHRVEREQVELWGVSRVTVLTKHDSMKHFFPGLLQKGYKKMGKWVTPWPTVEIHFITDVVAKSPGTASFSRKAGQSWYHPVPGGYCPKCVSKACATSQKH